MLIVSHWNAATRTNEVAWAAMTPIMTTRANATIRHIHERMPVVIEPEDFERWLDCKTQEPREISDLMRPVEEDFFEALPVSDLVNKVANMGPELQKPVAVASPEEEPPKKKGCMGCVVM